MSNWPGNLIRKTPVTPAGPLQNGAAPGVWSLSEASYWTKQGLWPTAGNFLAVEDVFSTFLYTGTGAAQTITNGINLSGQGGLVWLKMRSPGSGFSSTQSHALFDTVRGDDKYLCSDLSNGQFTFPNNGITFNSSGFGIDAASFFGGSGDQSTSNFASWTFREAPNFFDVVTWTGNGVAGRQIAHNLGSVPGMIIVKQTNGTEVWRVYHRSTGNGQTLTLNTTAAAGATSIWDTTSPTSTSFTVGASPAVNGNGDTYVAYLFAHDTASTGLIQCGSYTGNGSATGPIIDLGWEPQWLLIKNASASGRNWLLFDNMRGMVVGSADAYLVPNAADAEASFNYLSPTATGFQITATDGSVNNNGQTFIYVAIRRGPMKTPTLGTSVLSVKNYAATTTSASVTHDVTFDVEINANRDVAIAKFLFVDSLRGINGVVLRTGATTTESTFPTYWSRNGQRGMYAPSAFDAWWAATTGTNNHISYGLVRAPGFFDEVCYTGTGSATAFNHNLGVAPELMIVKTRSTALSWIVNANLTSTTMTALTLNTTNAGDTGTYSFIGWLASQPTATTFTPAAGGILTQSGVTYVAYLFASCPGVSKVGSYTGTGALQTINCAFTTGARFVLIKRTDSTGDWYVWDSTRGITSGNDPYMLLNSFDAEVTGTNYVDTDTTGFKVTAAAPAGVNASGGTYIFLAIA